MTNLASNVWLEACLAPFQPFLDARDVTDIHVNTPGELWTETLGGGSQRHEVKGLDTSLLERFARQVAAFTAQGVNRENPLLAANLPTGERIQIALPPATRGDIAISIRKHVTPYLTLDDYTQGESFAPGIFTGEGQMPRIYHNTAKADPVSVLRTAVQNRANILISGGTSSGKTTFLNALARDVSADERLLLIEDTPELQMGQANVVGLLAPRGQMGEARVTMDDLLIAALRMRPDRIILGEIRGHEAGTFLRAINTGHPGSLSTIHANTPQGAIDQLIMLVLQTGNRMRWEDLERYVRRSVDVIVQLERNLGRRVVSEIYFPADHEPVA